MRTTIDIDNDLLRLVKHLAREKEQTLSRVVSDLVRQGLRPASIAGTSGVIPILPKKPGARPVTSEIVKHLLEAEE